MEFKNYEQLLTRIGITPKRLKGIFAEAQRLSRGRFTVRTADQ